MSPHIPFNRSTLQGGEIAYIHEALASGQISGDHQFSHRCEELLEREVGSQRALVTTSCTHALEMAAMLLNIEPGDEVIVPSYTFVSTANAFARHGARPVFCDVRPDTLNLDEQALESLITPATRAIVPVHYAGVGCEMDTIMAMANEREIAVVEDNAHGLFGTYKGQQLGSFGVLATQSFHETKNITCGEGGALLINDESLVKRAEILREKGTDRSRFFRGEVDKYQWVDTGSSYVMSDVLAAFLYGQLEQHESIQARRGRLWRRYDEALADFAARLDIQRPVVPEHCDSAYHMYHFVFPDPDMRTAFIAHLKAADIGSVFHYLPLHLTAFAEQWGGKIGDCPVTERVADTLCRLPFYTSMSDLDQERVIDTILEFEPV
ncbi:MAG: dTDP-4-amino-4,6-dideoxygalactose transaminase [Actinomycetota bacterium]